jgi:hypothetical protein
MMQESHTEVAPHRVGAREGKESGQPSAVAVALHLIA